MEGLIALAVLLVIVLIVLVNCIKIVPQAHAMVIERFGRISHHMERRTSPQGAIYRQNSKESHLKGAGGRFPATACNHKG